MEETNKEEFYKDNCKQLTQNLRWPWLEASRCRSPGISSADGCISVEASVGQYSPLLWAQSRYGDHDEVLIMCSLNMFDCTFYLLYFNFLFFTVCEERFVVFRPSYQISLS